MENRQVRGLEITRFEDERFWYVTVDGAVLRKWSSKKQALTYARTVRSAIGNAIGVNDYQTEKAKQ